MEGTRRWATWARRFKPPRVMTKIRITRAMPVARGGMLKLSFITPLMVFDWMKFPPIIWVTMKKAVSTASQGRCSPFFI